MDAKRIIEEKTIESGDCVSQAITIAIPTYRHDPGDLIRSLAACERAEDAHIVIYDDGSCDADLVVRLEQSASDWPGKSTIVIGAENAGRSHARNRLIAHSNSDWILFLDADMLPDSVNFLTSYLSAITNTTQPALIAGGFSLQQVTPNPSQTLHAAQSRTSECIEAKIRSKEPGRYVFTSNILAHRKVLETIFFDDGFSGWGWEDTDWGLRVAKAFPVIHIDNTATHMGLDNTNALISKYGNSGENFARMVRRNPQEADTMALTKAARKLAKLPGRPIVRSLSKLAAKSSLPASLRLKALKLYRAAVYAEHIN